MKKSKYIVTVTGISAIVLITLLVSFTPKSPPTNGDIAIIRIFETANDNASKIIISYDNHKHEEIDLWGYRETYIGEWFDNADTIASTIHRFREMGYEIISSTSGGKLSSYKDQLVTTHILEKQN